MEKIQNADDVNHKLIFDLAVKLLHASAPA